MTPKKLIYLITLTTIVSIEKELFGSLENTHYTTSTDNHTPTIEWQSLTSSLYKTAVEHSSKFSPHIAATCALAAAYGGYQL